MRVKDAVGRYGEQLAGEFLEASGLVLLERNWRCREGELDIVARDGTALVFVEVKTRSSLAYGSPAEAIDRRKAARIRRLGVLWMAAHRPHEPGHTFWDSVRFDVVAVVRGGEPGRRTCVDIDHLVGAF